MTATNPLHADHYADQSVHETVEIEENIAIATDTFRLRFRSPEICRTAIPGQFVMLRLDGLNDPLIGRPLAIYNVDEDDNMVDVVYLVKGKLTSRLAQCDAGQCINVWGPLGNGFPAFSVPHLIMVAGGIGQTPFVLLGKEYLGRQSFGTTNDRHASADRVTLCYGARSANLLAGVEDFEAIGADVRLCTDDGSRGRHGLVTDLLRETLDEAAQDAHIACCGPEPMMEAVARIAVERNVPCHVSLETPMACGIGICFTCVAKVTDNSDQWDYKRTCVDGPIFPAEKIVWD